MQAMDPANPGLITLTATLRNHATLEVGYPALDVVLTNTKNFTVARRIFLPTDYIGAGKDTRGGIVPSPETKIRLNLDTGDLGAVGVRLDLLNAAIPEDRLASLQIAPNKMKLLKPGAQSENAVTFSKATTDNFGEDDIAKLQSIILNRSVHCPGIGSCEINKSLYVGTE